MKINEVKQFSKLFDNTFLGLTPTKKSIDEFVDQTLNNEFRSIGIPGYYVPQVLPRFRGTGVGILSGTGFPYGNEPTEVKIEHFKYWISLGEEITDCELINNVMAVKDGAWDYLENELRVMASIAHEHNKIFKYLIEAPMLTDEEIKRVVEMAMKLDDVDYIKTATGSCGKTTYHHVEVIHSITADEKKIKVAGGVQTLEQVEHFLELGASVFGCSSSKKILDEYNEKYKK